ncbi:MAG: hypothetical protein KGM47_14585, partial [Acidobacteriota bacterium]|nr:hypothetical protein [Acidobacteriota bacterium]
MNSSQQKVSENENALLHRRGERVCTRQRSWSNGLAALLMCAGLLIAARSAFAQAKGYETVTFTPAHLEGMQVSFNVILPQDYAATTRRFPVLYLLHGYTGHYSDWVT